MGVRRVGFEGKLYWGAAGSTASTELTIARDVSYKFEPSRADVSDRSSIIRYSRVAMVGFSLEFEVNNDASDAFIAAVRTAAAAGTSIAFATEDYSGGWGVDGDFTVDLEGEEPLEDAQRYKITAEPTNDTRAATWS